VQEAGPEVVQCLTQLEELVEEVMRSPLLPAMVVVAPLEIVIGMSKGEIMEVTWFAQEPQEEEEVFTVGVWVAVQPIHYQGHMVVQAH
jgi:hypothetical protein